MENENESSASSSAGSESNLISESENASAEKLKQFILRIERLEAEKADISTDIKEVYDEIGIFGLDKKIVRKVIARRKKTAQEVAEEEMMIQNYMENIQGI